MILLIHVSSERWEARQGGQRSGGRREDGRRREQRKGGRGVQDGRRTAGGENSVLQLNVDDDSAQHRGVVSQGFVVTGTRPDGAADPPAADLEQAAPVEGYGLVRHRLCLVSFHCRRGG